jgi:PAS domain S-box-containing protein
MRSRSGALPALLALTAVGVWGWAERTRALSGVSRVVDRTEVALSGGRLVHRLQLERGTTSAWLELAEPEPSPPLLEARDAVDRHGAEYRARGMDRDDRSLDALSLVEQRAVALLDSLPEIRARVDRKRITSSETIAYFSRLNEALVDVIVRGAFEGDETAVLRHASSYVSILRIKEAAGIERGVLAAALTRGVFAGGEREVLMSAAVRQEAFEDYLLSTAAPPLRERLLEELAHPVTLEALRFRHRVLNEGPSTDSLTPAQWFQVQTERIDRLLRLEEEALHLLRDAAVAAQRKARRQRNAFGSAALLLLVVSASAASFPPGTRGGASLRSEEGGGRPKPAGPEDVKGIFERVPVGLYRTSGDGLILEANPVFARMLGYERVEDLRGRNVEELYVDPADRMRWKASIEGQGVVRDSEIRVRRADGRVIWVSDTARVIGEPNTGTISYEGCVVEVTQRRVAEQEVRKLSAAVSHSADLVMITDADGRIEYVNPAFERASGYTREELRGMRPSVLKSGRHDETFYANLWGTILAGKDFRRRFMNRRKDGSYYHTFQTISPVRDGSGEIRNFLAIGKEISEEVDLEKRLRQTQKLQAVGQLAAGIAHDFNNLLSVVTGNVAMVIEDLPPEVESLKDDLRMALDAADRGAALTQKLLGFGRRQATIPRPLDLVRTVRDFETMARRLIPASIKLTVVADHDETWVHMDPNQIDQVLLNLLVNARDAMPDGGELTLRIGRRGSQDRPLDEGVDLRPGLWAVLEVTDTGCGMDDATLERIFDPFFTTKGSERGTGLGLASVYGIVAQNGGGIGVTSAPGTGTRFRIFLPESEPVDRFQKAPPASGSATPQT